jgi:hypothetical protein
VGYGLAVFDRSVSSTYLFVYMDLMRDLARLSGMIKYHITGLDIINYR